MTEFNNTFTPSCDYKDQLKYSDNQDDRKINQKEWKSFDGINSVSKPIDYYQSLSGFKTSI